MKSGQKTPTFSLISKFSSWIPAIALIDLAMPMSIDYNFPYSGRIKGDL